MGATKTTLEILETLKGKYEPVIGLEVHVQLLTHSKIFCGCSTRFGDPPNTNTCPVCLGLPGALPVLNREAVAMAVKASLALNCRVNQLSRFARKNYFYPDLPKGYQISQYDQPLAEHGWLIIHGASGEEKRIGITRLHLEEDAGKSIHDGFHDSNEKTYVDLNRSGVPLVEIVSEPELRSSEEAYDYLTRLKQILLYLGVSDCNMEEGSLRCDANVSVRPRGQAAFGVKAEVKNLNSFRYLQRALDYEIARQAQVLENGGQVVQETRLWNQRLQRTEGMRSKEYAHDYRYFPEPDLLPMVVSNAWQEEIRQTIPELPEAKRRRLMEQYGLKEYDAEVLTASQELAHYFEQVAEKASSPILANQLLEILNPLIESGLPVSELPTPAPKLAANWVMGELLGALKAAGKEISECPVSAEGIAELLELITNGQVARIVEEIDQLMAQQKPLLTAAPVDKPSIVTIQQLQEYEHRHDRIRQLNDELRKMDVLSGKMAKDVFEKMFASGKSAQQIVEELGLHQISDVEQIRTLIRQIMAANPKQLEQYRTGKSALFGFFVGQVMKETKRQANPQKVNELLKEELGKGSK
ncbi:MAG: Asp-tRNA(Asn)/Glu-tRNA(Gln) amidotransferase subunit GatB [Acidobacteria bacterium]|nr:Asp-tRNA(Asn)/Glu-tRNA(Gln) amidotransferase subunit GatB [Acidobacteriota bacterium]